MKSKNPDVFAFFVLEQKLGYYCITGKKDKFGNKKTLRLGQRQKAEMYCEKCGADNSEKAVYCRICGVRMGDGEEETRVAARRDVETLERGDAETLTEKEIFSISPTLVFVKMGYVLAAFGALLLVAVTSAFTSISAGWAVLLGLLLFLIPAYYHFKRKLLRYTLTDTILQIDSGFIARTTRNVPVTRIQDVTVAATPWQRLLGIGDLIVDNASEQGGKLTLKNINSPKKYADELLRQMRLLDK